MAIAVRRSPIHASRFARVLFSDASALRLRVGIQIKPKRTRGETSGTVAERASRRGFARRGLPPVRACALCIGQRRGGNPYTVRKSVARKFKFWKRTGKLWDTLTIRRPSDRIGFGRSSSGKSQKLRRLHVSRDVCPCFGIQECTTKLFGSPDSDASPHLSLALAFPLPASGDRRPLRSPTRGAG